MVPGEPLRALLVPLGLVWSPVAPQGPFEKIRGHWAALWAHLAHRGSLARLVRFLIQFQPRNRNPLHGATRTGLRGSEPLGLQSEPRGVDWGRRCQDSAFRGQEAALHGQESAIRARIRPSVAGIRPGDPLGPKGAPMDPKRAPKGPKRVLKGSSGPWALLGPLWAL